MDSSLWYMLVFLLSLLLSWFLYRRFISDSNVEDQLSALMNSGGKFVFGLILLFAIPSLTLLVSGSASAFFIYLVIGFSLITVPILRYPAVAWVIAGTIVYFMDKPQFPVIEAYPLVIVGSVLFQFGFAKMHALQLLRNIPRSKIRSVAVGAVEISGTIVSKNVLTTPFSKSPCVLCLSQLEIYSVQNGSESDEDGTWEEVAGPAFKIPFWLNDETGEIMVDP